MFRDLDDTLAAILDDADAPAELRNADVSFELPDEDFAPDQATVNLYLYELHENRELRDPVPIVEKTGNGFRKRRPPLRVECTYMVTAWSNQVGAAQVAEEHRLLSQALLWLSRFPTLPEQHLQGSLVDPPFPHPSMAAQMAEGKSLGEFWAALGQPPRPSFNLDVTIAMELGLESGGDLVTTPIAGHSQRQEPSSREQRISIGGRVLSNEATPQPIAGAWVAIDDKAPLVTDAEGRFALASITSGSHTLRAVAPGFQSGERPIVVPGPSQGYEIRLDAL